MIAIEHGTVVNLIRDQQHATLTAGGQEFRLRPCIHDPTRWVAGRIDEYRLGVGLDRTDDFFGGQLPAIVRQTLPDVSELRPRDAKYCFDVEAEVSVQFRAFLLSPCKTDADRFS